MSSFLIEKGAGISDHQDGMGNNLLHRICKEARSSDFLPILQLLLEKVSGGETGMGE